MNKTPPTIKTRPPNTTEELLSTKFDEEFTNQPQRLDEIAKLLITIELAIPGLYATALKLINGDKATLTLSLEVYFAFIFWALALLFTLLAILPRTYNVDRAIIRRTTPHEFLEPLSIEAYFKKSATYKYEWIVTSCIYFFIGIIFAVYSIL